MPRATGASELRVLAKDLKLAGSAGRGIRNDLRRELIVAAKPIEAQVKRNARAIPAVGMYGSTGLRRAIANATRTSIKLFGKDTWIRVLTDGRKMPAGQTTLPAYMEGSDGYRKKAWRHPVYGNDGLWVDEASHPYFQPAIPPHLPAVYRAVDIAVDKAVRRVLR